MLKECHNLPATGGHLAFYPTYMRIHANYWWPRMWKDIDQYIKSCFVCQKVNVPPGLKKQGTFGVKKAYQPWEDVQCDMLMGLPTTD